MRNRRLSDIARATGGLVSGEDSDVSWVTTDSRVSGPGALFVAIRGDHADGHAFAGEALARGAAGVMVDEDAAGIAGPTVAVRDTGRALLALAADERRAMSARVIGVTGANGKTSTKDLATAVLETRFRTHASPSSFNNEVGVPITLLGAPPGTEALVCEMGARHVGDVAALFDVVRPDTVVVTNVGVAHMELFGSWDRIVEASAEPVEAMGPNGTVILAADDPVVRGYSDRTAARVMTFGIHPDADVRADDVALGPDGRAAFVLAVGGEREHVDLAVPGEHMVQNALAATACGVVLGIAVSECAVALKDAQVSHWRMESFVTAAGVRVINDAYNANPESMAAGLKAARWAARDGRLIAVLGHMAELGSVSAREHERLGALVVRLRVDRLITVGEEARSIASAALREGMPPGSLVTFDDAAGALADVDETAGAGDVILLKGSRVCGLETLAEELRCRRS